MQATKMEPLGFRAATAVLKIGRSAFFGGTNIDLPFNRSTILCGDDLTPQFGYVGSRYKETRLLLLGINPGNGKETEVRSETDERMMPALIRFASNPTVGNFAVAQAAYQAECETWHVWRRHCKEVIGAGKLSLDQIAYSNSLPWRTGSESRFDDSVAERAAALYTLPLIEELEPKLIVAMGKRAAEVLHAARRALPPVIVWNRAQAATESVLRDSAHAAAEVFSVLGRSSTQK